MTLLHPNNRCQMGSIVDKYEQEDSLSIIAHEIAHAYLGHEPRHVRDEVNLPAESRS